MTTLLAENVRRAAHGLHRCGICAGTIPARSHYLDQRVAGEGRVWTFRCHMSCHDFYWRLHRDFGLWDDDEIAPGDFRQYVLEAMTGMASVVLGPIPGRNNR